MPADDAVPENRAECEQCTAEGAEDRTSAELLDQPSAEVPVQEEARGDPESEVLERRADERTQELRGKREERDRIGHADRRADGIQPRLDPGRRPAPRLAREEEPADEMRGGIAPAEPRARGRVDDGEAAGGDE